MKSQNYDYEDDYDFNLCQGKGGSQNMKSSCRSGGKRSKKEARDNTDKIYNSKTARKREALLAQVKKTSVKDKKKKKKK